MRLVLPSLVLLSLAGVSQAQAPAPAGNISWWCLKDHPGWIALFVDDAYVGRLDPFEGYWLSVGRPADRPADLRTHTLRNSPPKGTGAVIPVPGPRPREVQTPPATAPRPRAGVKEESDLDGPGPPGKPPVNLGPEVHAPLFGVDRSDPPAGERWLMTGAASTKDGVMQAIAGGPGPPSGPAGPHGIPNDSRKIFVTAIGDNPAGRQQVLDDFARSPELAPWRDRVIVQGFSRAAWQINGRDGQGRGFAVPADAETTSVCVEAPTGQVLLQVDSYAGPEPMRAGLLDKVPGVDPAAFPRPGTGGAWWLLLAVGAVGGVAIAALVKRHRNPLGVAHELRS